MGEIVTRNEGTLELITEMIRAHVRGAYQNLIEVGRLLTVAKERKIVPHGRWESWVTETTGMTERQAQRLMQAAREVPAGSAMEQLPISKVQVLLALPAEEREAAAEKVAKDGTSLRELRSQIQRERERSRQLQDQVNRGIERIKDLRTRANQMITDARDEGFRAGRAEAREMVQRDDRRERELAEALEASRQELAEAERYAEEQARLRQEAQQLLLNAQASAQDGGGGIEVSIEDIVAAIRAFMGAAGMLPAMPAALAALGDGDRRTLETYVDMVARWVDDSRAAIRREVVYCD